MIVNVSFTAPFSVHISSLILHPVSVYPRCSQGVMGSRALSHDSIFLADQVLIDTEPARVLSQENVHDKIKALQV